MKKVAVLVCAVMVSALWVCCAFGAGSRKADIVFFIDSSSSMQDEIDGVRTNLASFSSAMRSSSIDVRFAILDYRNGDEINTHRPDGTNIWTSDTSQVESVLRSIRATADEDGSTMGVINEIFSWGNFRSDASRFGFMLTDVIRIGDVFAFYDEDTGETYYVDFSLINENTTSFSELLISEEQGLQVFNSSMAGTIQQLKNMNMHVSVISTSGLRQVYQNLYSQTGGEFMDITGDYASTMLRIASYIEETIDEDTGNGDTNSTSLPYMPIEAIPTDELSQRFTNDDGTTETLLERIARQANITSGEINVITEENKHLYGLAPAPEPSEEARQAAGNDEFIAKLNSLTLYSGFQQAGEKGYFLCKIDIPDAVAKLGLTTDKVKLLSVSQEESGEASGIFRTSGTEPLSYLIMHDLLGLETTALEDAAYMLFMGQVADKIILYALRIILMLLGGCEALAGIGTTGLLAAGGVILLRKFARKH